MGYSHKYLLLVFDIVTAGQQIIENVSFWLVITSKKYSFRKRKKGNFFRSFDDYLSTLVYKIYKKEHSTDVMA